MTPPYKVGLFFVRDSKRKFDFINACQIVADMMVEEGWIEDDNADFFTPVFLGYSVDKKNAGVHILPMPNYDILTKIDQRFRIQVSPNFSEAVVGHYNKS